MRSFIKHIRKILVPALALVSLGVNANVITLDFSNGVDRYDPSGQDSDNKPFTLLGDTLTLSGDSWKSVTGNFVISSDTVLKFELFIEDAGEIIGVGFDTDNTWSGSGEAGNFFQFAGSQNGPFTASNPQYDALNVWQLVELSLSDLAGQTFSRMVFITDDDRKDPLVGASFRSVQTAANQVPAPASIALLGAVLLLLGRFARK